MKKNSNSGAYLAYAILISLVSAFWIGVGKLVRLSQEKPLDTKYDTMRVVVRDTITCYQPVPKDSIIKKYVFVKLPKVECCSKEQISRQETACLDKNVELSENADSAEVYLPITTYTFQDSTYKAVVSGFHVSLDYIETYKQKEYVYTKEKKRLWGAGVQIGCTYNGKVMPYVGVGIQYNILQW